MPHRAALAASLRPRISRRPGATRSAGPIELTTIGEETFFAPLGFGEPRFRAGRGASLQPSDFAIALADFQSGIAPRIRRARRAALEDELPVFLTPARLRGSTEPGLRARLLRRKLTSFGSVVEPSGTAQVPFRVSRKLQALVRLEQAPPRGFVPARGARS